ncbi:hypothetical protein SLE2022_251130 [Rubroshorea leprosula]
MAAFGWNLRRVNNMQHDQFSQARQTRSFILPSVPNQIACRICNQVFTSTQGLITHIESHMIQDETIAAARRQQLDPSRLFSSHRDLFSNPYNNIPSFSPQQFDNFGRHYHHVQLPMQYPSYPPLLPQDPNPLSILPSSQLSLYNRNNHHFSLPQPQFLPAVAPYAGYQGRQQRTTMQHSPSNDHTKPFLVQLENMREPEYDKGRSDFDAVSLDLTLKL